MARVFISYNSQDRGFVEQLVKDLQSNDVEPWYDRLEMLPGDSLTQNLGSAILDNDFFAVVLSPNSVASEWVTRELGVALIREFQERQVKVIPVLYQECQIPPFLLDKVFADFRDNYGQGLNSLLRAVGSDIPAEFVATSLPTPRTQGVHWDNVIGTNLNSTNIFEANSIDDNGGEID